MGRKKHYMVSIYYRKRDTYVVEAESKEKAMALAHNAHILGTAEDAYQVEDAYVGIIDTEVGGISDEH